MIQNENQKPDYEDLRRAFYKRLSLLQNSVSFARGFAVSHHTATKHAFSLEKIAKTGVLQFPRLLTGTGIKLIDFENFEKNSFHVCTELTCKNGDDEFRPDITIFINRIPLVFIEVKKPNNKDGIKAERDRINARFQNKKFRRFINAAQFMIFSNNMEYDNESNVPIQGVLSSTKKAVFNCFCEEDNTIFENINPIDKEDSNFTFKPKSYNMKHGSGVRECGRARWKIENEHNNVLKHHGYHLEHNFGHGQEHACEIYVLLNLLAFQMHGIL